MTLLINVLTILVLACVWSIAGVLVIVVTGRLLRKCVSAGIDFVLRD